MSCRAARDVGDKSDLMLQWWMWMLDGLESLM